MSKTIVKRGRPADTRARLSELRQTPVERPDVRKVLETATRAALDNNRKKQAAAKDLNGSRAGYECLWKAVDIREKINVVIDAIWPEKEAIEGLVIERCGR